jgi:hypothetical protein
MSKVRFTLNILAAVVFTMMVASMAQAQATRTWVSGVGDDVNPCSRTAPCKTWAGAISKTAVGGEIDALDPGGFGALTINKSITIEGTQGGGFGHTLASVSSGIIVNVTTNPGTAVVILRNLYINGVRRCTTAGCGGTNGIRYLAGDKLIVDRCTVSGFLTNGIDAQLTTAGNLVVTQSTFEDNNIGIRATSTAANINVSVNDSKIIGGSSGIDGISNAQIAVSNCLISHNSANGIIGESGTINVADSRITHNGTGVNALAGVTIRIARNIITNNTNALGLGGTIESGGNNTIMGNNTNQAPNGVNTFPQN